jgi:hypothetical protein
MFLPSFVRDKNGEFPVRQIDGTGRAGQPKKIAGLRASYPAQAGLASQKVK